MASERVIKQKVRAELEAEGFVTWVPPKVKFQETDIFGIWDLLAWRGELIRAIQYTSDSNVSARRRKVQEFFAKHGVHYPTEVWGWNAKKKLFRKIYL